MNHRQWRGTVQYIGDTVGERGREWFHRTERPDGTILVRSVSEMDDSDILRDVTYALDSQNRPLDCYERLTVRGATSMAWFHFSEHEAACEGIYADIGRVSQRVSVPFWPQFFSAHPLWNDALVPAAYDREKGGRQSLTGLASSLLVNGSTGPILNRDVVECERIGDETLEVPAGRYDCDIYRLYYGPGHAKSEDIWCTGNFLFVKVRNDELNSTYLLGSYDEI